MQPVEIASHPAAAAQPAELLQVAAVEDVDRLVGVVADIEAGLRLVAGEVHRHRRSRHHRLGVGVAADPALGDEAALAGLAVRIAARLCRARDPCHRTPGCGHCRDRRHRACRRRRSSRNARGCGRRRASFRPWRMPAAMRRQRRRPHRRPDCFHTRRSGRYICRCRHRRSGCGGCRSRRRRRGGWSWDRPPYRPAGRAAACR